MRKIILILTTIILLTGWTSGYTQNVEQYTIAKINSPITIDGELDEKVWSLAKPTKNFVILGSGNNPSNAAFAKMLWDDTYLYIGFFCPDAKIWATYTDRDAALYKEDVVEVYIDPDGDGTNYLEIEVNPLNAIFDLWLTKPWSDGGKGDVAWTMQGMQTAISIDGSICDNSDEDTAWFCEMALPFSEMAFSAPARNYPPNEYDKWRMNLYRFNRSSTNNSVGDLTGWCVTNGSAHEPEKFGVITFGSLMTDVQTSLTEQFAHQVVLQQNYPNPFNPTTHIHYTLPVAEKVTVAVYDLAGRRITTLVDAYQAAGEHYIAWTASGLPSGVYLYQIHAGNVSQTKKCILQK